jgi:hypothetical protein
VLLCFRAPSANRSSSLTPLFKSFTGLLDLRCENLLIWQGKLVFPRQDFVREPFEHVSRDGIILLRAQDKTDWRVFFRMRPMLARVVEVKVHLPGIGVGKLADLQVDNYEAA